MKFRYKLSLTLILIAIFSLCMVGIGYKKYLSERDNKEAMIKVKSGLSINYLNGNVINTSNENYELNFSVSNTTEEPIYFYVKLDKINASPNVTYEFSNADNSDIKTEDISNSYVANRVKILPSETKSYAIKLNNPNKNELNVLLNVDLENIDNSLSNVIIGHNEIKSDPSNGFDIPEVNDDGLIEKRNEEGTTYYFRGAVANNYVSFANRLWRIVRINPDDTVLVVLDDLLETKPFYETNEEESTSFLDSSIYNYLSTWYEENISMDDEYVSGAKYCTDDNAEVLESGQVFYLGEDRIFNNYAPVITCPGTQYTSKIGILTADDVMYAGASLTENRSYYLMKEGFGNWWTMTPNKKEDGRIFYISVMDDGSLSKDHIESEENYVRPALTLIKKVNATGDGTILNPFVLTLQ